MLKYIKSQAQTVIVLVILGLFFALTFMSTPGDAFYHVKKTWYNAQSFVAPTLLNKATVRLQVVEGLIQTFNETQSKNPRDPKLLEIAKELVGQEQAGIYYLDLAKKDNASIKSQVQLLCNALQTQQIAITSAYVAASPDLQPQLQATLSKTDVYLSQATNW